MENHLGEQITFFHLDCLCSDVRLNVDFDLTLTVLADLLYRSLAERLKGFARAGPARLFRKFVDTPGVIEITAEGVIVRLSKRAHNPLLERGGADEADATSAVAGRSVGASGVPVTTPGQIPTPAGRGTLPHDTRELSVD